MGKIAIIGQKRPLYELLKQKEADLFLLCGDAGSAARKVFEFMQAKSGSWDPWQHIFLIQAAAEKQIWFGANASDRYVVLRGPASAKQAVRQGPAVELLTAGEPDILTITDAFIS